MAQYIDTGIEVVEFKVRNWTYGTTTSYYISKDYYAADALYTGSPEIYPLLVDSPPVIREVGEHVAVRISLNIRVYAKAPFTSTAFTFADLGEATDFHNAKVNIYYFTRSFSSLSGTYTAANDKRLTELYCLGWSMDDQTGIASFQVREVWFKDKVFGTRFTSAHFGTGSTEWSNKWLNEPVPIPFGGVFGSDGDYPVVTNAPVIYNSSGTSGGNTYNVLRIAYAEYNDDLVAIEGGDLVDVYVANPHRDIDNSTWIRAFVTDNAGYSSSLILDGPTTLIDGTTYYARQWRFAQRYTTFSDDASLIASVTLRTKRVGTISSGDGRFSVKIFRAKQIAGSQWTIEGSALGEAEIDASALSTSTANVEAYFKQQPVILPANTDYFFVAEWSRKSTRRLTVTAATNATPIAITTSGDHGMSTGDSCTIKGVLGNTAANGTFVITSTGAKTFTLDSSVGSGAYTGEGNVEVNTGCPTLHWDGGTTTDPVYTNDQTENAEIFTETSAQFQLQIRAYFRNTSVTSTTVNGNIVKLVELLSANTGTMPTRVSNVDFKVECEGLLDDSSDTYTGVSANFPIYNPAHIIHYILRDNVHGMGLTTDYFDEDDLKTDERPPLEFVNVFVVETPITCEQLIVRLCEQSGLRFYRTRLGKLTVKKPSPPTAYTIKLSEGAMRGDLILDAYEDQDYGAIINKIDVVYQPDVLQQNTDPHFIKTSVDPGYRGREYIYSNDSSQSDSNRQSVSGESINRFGERYDLKRLDLLSNEEPAYKVMNYFFDRNSTMPRQCVVRVPRKDWYTTIDIFSHVQIQHTGISHNAGCAEFTPGHVTHDPCLYYDEGIPALAWSGGVIEGEVVRVVEQDEMMEITVRTVGPYAALAS